MPKTSEIEFLEAQVRQAKAGIRRASGDMRAAAKKALNPRRTTRHHPTAAIAVAAIAAALIVGSFARNPRYMLRLLASAANAARGAIAGAVAGSIRQQVARIALRRPRASWGFPTHARARPFNSLRTA